MILVLLALFINMHDFHLADQIKKIVLEHAAKNGFKNISKIEIELGDIIEHGETINPDNLIFHLKALGLDAEINVKKIKGDKWSLVSLDGDQ